MRPFPLVRVRGLLQAERQFAVALPEAERLFGLNRRFAGVVPAAVARACRIAALQGDIAVIFCANGAAASRVRAQAKGVASALSCSDAPVGSIKVKILADWSVPAPAEKHDIPAAGINAFKALETSLPDGDLKMALERLLNRRR
ncbi:MAG: DciA family protein [Pseudomonadota bacterium]|nr:DciA family protein [Pseudomonadota bacterium]